jgi:hypothetical protein
VGAVHREDLKALTVQIANPASDVRSLAIPGIDHGISIGCEPSLTGRELIQAAQREP